MQTSYVKTPEQIQGIRESGRRLARVMNLLGKRVAPGVSTKDLDAYAYQLITERGDTPSFLHYCPEGVTTPYPASLCVSINDEVVHGIPDENIILREGDIVTLDCGINHRGYFTDHAVTFPVGKIDPADQKLIDDTREALMIGIASAQVGHTTGDIGHAIETFVSKRYGIVRILSGHGVGLAVHEDPYVPNYGKQGTGTQLVPGMVLALEPMLTRGTDDVDVCDDEYTYVTSDGSQSAHFEHTIVITEHGPEIVTQES